MYSTSDTYQLGNTIKFNQKSLSNDSSNENQNKPNLHPPLIQYKRKDAGMKDKNLQIKDQVILNSP